MKKLFLLLLLATTYVYIYAQDSITFKGKVYNDEYNIYIDMNLYNQDIIVPTQEIFGKLAGYIGSLQCTQVWPITNCKIIDGRTATISLINNYGSEDLVCTLKLNENNTYTLNKENGSVLKFPVKGKWQKIPNTISFKRKK